MKIINICQSPRQRDYWRFTFKRLFRKTLKVDVLFRDTEEPLLYDENGEDIENSLVIPIMRTIHLAQTKATPRYSDVTLMTCSWMLGKRPPSKRGRTIMSQLY